MRRYEPYRVFRNSHINSIYHSEIRTVLDLTYVREQFELPDGDFVDLDWSVVGGKDLAVILHGLESHTERPYMKGMAKALNEAGFDTVSMSFRGCGGRSNRLLRFYHSGDTGDLKQVLGHLSEKTEYPRIFLVGFSLGANILLKFLGEEGEGAGMTYRIAKSAAVSAPCDLLSASIALDKMRNFMYRRRFLKKLEKSLIRKQFLYPQDIDMRGFRRIRSMRAYDERFTAPQNGFKDALDYYAQSSSKPYLPLISSPVLIINALDDPFLGPECYPNEEDLKANEYVEWCLPAFGGHVGFSNLGRRAFWHEETICAYFRELGDS